MDISCIKEQLYFMIWQNASNIPENMKIDDDARLIEDLNYDSVDLVQLLVDIEDTYGMELEDEAYLLRNMETAGKLAMWIFDKIH